MLSAPAHQIVLVVNGIYLLENLKLDDAVAKNAYEFTFSITLPLFLLHSGPASGEIVPVGDGALVDLAGLVESGRRAVPYPLAAGNERHGPRQSLTWPGDRGFESAFLQRRVCEPSVPRLSAGCDAARGEAAVPAWPSQPRAVAIPVQPARSARCPGITSCRSGDL